MGGETAALQGCFEISESMKGLPLPQTGTSTANATCSYREHPPDCNCVAGPPEGVATHISMRSSTSTSVSKSCSNKKHTNSNSGSTSKIKNNRDNNKNYYINKKNKFVPPQIPTSSSSLSLSASAVAASYHNDNGKQYWQRQWTREKIGNGRDGNGSFSAVESECFASSWTTSSQWNTVSIKRRSAGKDSNATELMQLPPSGSAHSPTATATAIKSNWQHCRVNPNSKCCDSSPVATVSETVAMPTGDPTAVVPTTMVLQQIMPSLFAAVSALSSAFTAVCNTPLGSSRSAGAAVTLPVSSPAKTKAHVAAAAASAATIKRTKFRLLPSLGATSFFTLLTLVCLETVLLSTVSNCAKTFYMHWNTSNSIFRIDNTDHIIDVNKGNSPFEFDQVHIICPVYEPGTFENETEKYIIYNVSKVEYETCRITNADPRVIAICDKPQKLMFFTITFRPFTPQPGGLEFLPGNDYYFISTSSKDDLYRRIGGRCSTNNMKVVFKVCCAPEEKNKTTSTSIATSKSGSGNAAGENGADTVSGGDVINVDVGHTATNVNQQHINNINTIGISGVNTAMSGGVGGGSGININSASGVQLKPMSGSSGTSINTNLDQFNRIPIQTNGINVIGNNIGGNGVGLGSHGNSGIMLSPGGGVIGHGGHGGINMIPTGGGGIISSYPGHHPGQTGIRINNVPSQQHHPSHKNNINNNNNNNDDHHYDKHPNEVVKNEELTYNAASSLHRDVSLFRNWKLFNVFFIPEFIDSLFCLTSRTTNVAISESSASLVNTTGNLINLLATGISKDNIKEIICKFVFDKFSVNEKVNDLEVKAVEDGRPIINNIIIHKFMNSSYELLRKTMHIIYNFNPIMLLSISFVILMQFFMKSINHFETIRVTNVAKKNKTSISKDNINSNTMSRVSANFQNSRESELVSVSLLVPLSVSTGETQSKLVSLSVSESSLTPPNYNETARNISSKMNNIR